MTPFPLLQLACALGLALAFAVAWGVFWLLSTRRGVNAMPKTVTLKLLTQLVLDGEGKYHTYPSEVFQGKAYEEGEIIEYVSSTLDGLAPGGVVVPVTASWAVFQAIDNGQSGADAEGEDPQWEIIEGSVCNAETGTPIDPTSV